MIGPHPIDMDDSICYTVSFTAPSRDVSKYAPNRPIEMLQHEYQDGYRHEETSIQCNESLAGCAALLWENGGDTDQL